MADAAAHPDRYTAVARALHWSMALLILANLPLGFFSDAIEDGLGVSLVWVHKSIGLTVLALVVVRIGWRLMHPPPPLPTSVPAWESKLAGSVHLVLYALMILMPLTGYIMSSAGKYPLTWFELFGVPKLPVTRDDPIVGLSGGAHEILGWIMLVVAVGHIGAALRHHLILRDGVLKRMLA